MITNDIKSITIYINSICNLKCKYCFIYKDPYLNILDKLLSDNLKTNYYIDFVNNNIKNKESVRRFEIWGGEPLITIDRFIPIYRKLIPILPNMNELNFSTNFSSDNAYNNVKKLMDVLGEFPNRNFEIDMQISIDGPPEINDLSRGDGTTNRILENFDILIDNISNDIPSNVNVLIHTKSTISRDNFEYLDNKKNLISYFLFFENMINKTKNLNHKNIDMFPAVYNLVCPYEYTKDDGKKFSNICMLSREIMESKDNQLKYYNTIVPFKFRGKVEYADSDGYELSGGMCGSGLYTIGILPNNYVCTCHRAFQNFLNFGYTDNIINNENYMVSDKCFKLDNSKFIMPEYKLKNYTDKVECYYKKSTALLSQYSILIKQLADCDLIDSKYKDMRKALKAAKYLINCDGQCIHANEAETGSFITIHTGEFKLFLNGAIDQILGKEI